MALSRWLPVYRHIENSCMKEQKEKTGSELYCTPHSGVRVVEIITEAYRSQVLHSPIRCMDASQFVIYQCCLILVGVGVLLVLINTRYNDI
jgi:hypothetical protein